MCMALDHSCSSQAPQRAFAALIFTPLSVGDVCCVKSLCKEYEAYYVCVLSTK